MRYFVLGFFFLSMVSCDKTEYPVVTDDCSVKVIIDRDLHLSTSLNYFIDTISIDEDCIKIDLSESGCDGSTWIVDLIDSGDIAESLPAQRSLKLSLENKEECDAVISKSFYFDLTPLQTDDEEQFILHIEGWAQSVLYEY